MGRLRYLLLLILRLGELMLRIFRTLLILICLTSLRTIFIELDEQLGLVREELLILFAVLRIEIF